MPPETGQPTMALAAYETSHERTPTRFPSYRRAAAGEKLGGMETARRHYRNVVTLRREPDTERPELRDAKTPLAKD